MGSKVGRGDVDEYGELGKLGAIRAIGWGTVYNRFSIMFKLANWCCWVKTKFIEKLLIF